MKKSLICALSALYVIVCFEMFPAYGASVSTQGSCIVFDNSFFRYEVGRDGFTRSLVDKTSGAEYADQSVPRRLMYVEKGGKEYGSSWLTLENGILRAEFGNSGVVGFVKVDARDECFLFDLLKVEGADIDVFGIARLHLTIKEHIGTTLNVAYNEKFGVCLLGLNLQTHAEGTSQSKAILEVSCIPRFGMAGSRFAFIGCPIDQMLPIIGKLEIEFGLPHPTLDGEWDKVSRAVETSYLFVDGGQANIDSCIMYAKKGGFKYVMLLGGLFDSYGHYPFNKKMFPDEVAGLRATMRKLHDAGLKGGVHFLVGWISRHDPYVSPVPDKRIAKDGKFTLARDVSADADFIPTVQSPEGFPEEPQVNIGGCEIQIDDEIIRYTGLSTKPPYGFTGCKRGMYATQASSHNKASTVYHMLEFYGEYLVDADTDILDEMTSRMGEILNEGEVDMIYFDGGECMSGLGPAWYYIGKVKEAYYKKIKREILYQGSGTHTYAWHIYSRGNSDDWTALALKTFLDEHKVPDRVQFWHDNLLPAEFGWWGYFTHSPSVDATLPDEMEYGYSKGAGYDTPMGFETHLRDLAGNGRTDEILSMAKRWEELRLSGNLISRMKKELQTLGQEHTLIEDGFGNWNIHRISYGPDHWVKAHQPSTQQWKQTNPYLDQSVRVRIKAKNHYEKYGHTGNVPMTDFSMKDKFRSRTASGDLSITLTVSTEQVKAGSKSWKIVGVNNADRTSAWAELEYEYKEPITMLKNRGIGLWVYGDGSGALLNICPVAPYRYALREYYVKLDFTGWKYCELTEPNAEGVYHHEWPYGIKWPTRHFNFENVGRLAIYLNEIPAHKTVTCYLSPIEALAEKSSIISQPSLVINGSTVTFPVTLRDDEYVEYLGSGEAIHYSNNNFILDRFRPEGNAIIASGDNSIQFNCINENTAYRAKVTIITLGEAIRY